MKKIKILFILLFSALLTSCVSNQKPEIYRELDYTEADAVRDEIKRVQTLSESDSVKALWRSDLMLKKLKDNAEVLELYDFCLSSVKKDFEKSIEEKDYKKALVIYRSLVVIDSNASKQLKYSEKQLYELAYSGMPGLKASLQKNETSVKSTKVSEMIKGTVTVFVDKGIKVEKGLGMADAVLGSGFFISNDGYIVTNHHVIADLVDKKYEGFARLYIKLAEDPETRIPAKVIGWDSTVDLALLKTEINAPYVFELGNSKDLSVGDRIYAIGSPLGLEKTLTSGIISSLDRNLFTCGPVFQIDAAVNFGNSGGPLIDEKGLVQAVVFAGVQNYQGLNFAIPVEYLKIELPFLYSGGERVHVWSGCYGKTKRVAGSGAKNEGLTVNYVLPGSSAYLSGIGENEVITGLNDYKINCIEDMSFVLMQFDSGTIVTLFTQDDGGNKKSYNVYLEKRPEAPGYEIYRHDDITQALYPLIGIKLVNTSTLSKRVFNITEVLKGSTADESGFSENDPVQLMDIQFSPEKDFVYIQMYAKKRKNGYLDITISLASPTDSPYYF